MGDKHDALYDLAYCHGAQAAFVAIGLGEHAEVRLRDALDRRTSEALKALRTASPDKQHHKGSEL